MRAIKVCITTKWIIKTVIIFETRHPLKVHFVIIVVMDLTCVHKNHQRN